MCEFNEVTGPEIQRLIAGDNNAWENLILAWNSRLVNFAKCLLGQEDAEDAVQEAWSFVIVALPAGKMKQEELSINFLFIRIHNYASNIWRRNKRRRTSTSLDSSLNDEGFSLRDTLADDRDDSGSLSWLIRLYDPDELRRCIAELSDEAREVIDLRYFAGLSMEEIATTLGIPKGTVGSRLYYARIKLRELLIKDDDFRDDEISR